MDQVVIYSSPLWYFHRKKFLVHFQLLTPNRY
uniref:Uncharacterized protein n=1 Tax=Anguilla anguilla TaxID=7936 RepID=A0A0E9PRM3_ANGAN